MSNASAQEWKATACNLCYANCGVLVQTGGDDGRQIMRVKGDKNHPASRGYTCNKALQLNYYQNGKDRITAPLRRRADGTYEEIDWQTAIREVADKMTAIRDTHGGDKIFRYGGGGQGNHLGGGYFSSVSAALGMKHKTNALAQEKTGFGWMMGRMFGANVHGELAHAKCVFIVGKNPWQSNGFQRARVTLREASKDPERTLIVMDPRVTESAEIADIHLSVKPGRDAWALTAMIAHIIQEDLLPHEWLAEHTAGYEAVAARFRDISVDDYASFAGLKSELVKKAARAIATSESSAYYEDLGTQMSPHSTLVSYLNLILVTLTGHFGRADTMAVLTQLTGPFFGISDIGAADDNGYESEYNTSPVTGARIVAGLIPCNSVPDEILTDHPDRFRAMWIESGNPVHSMADSKKWREALQALDLVVVIDVAMTETAREADYVLPAPSQYEKWEATFFNFEYPANTHHLRAPLFEPAGNTLPEPEIHARIFEAMNVFDLELLDPLREAAAEGLDVYGPKAFAFLSDHPELAPYMSYILYRTLGPSLPNGAAAAALYWPIVQRFALSNEASVRRAGYEGEGMALGNALFNAILNERSGIVFSVEDINESFDKIGFSDKKIQLNVAEMLDEVDGLAGLSDLVEKDAEFPFLLAAGERRSYTANTVVRDPKWMKSNDATSMAIHPSDAASAGIADGGRVRIVTKAGEAVVEVTHDKRMQPGTLSIPNGVGLLYPDEKGKDQAVGVAPNELTHLSLKDKFFGTPFHKHVPARLEVV